MPMIHTRRNLSPRWAGAFLLVALATQVHAQETAIVQVDPRTQARVELSPKHLAIHFLLSGKTQMFGIEPTGADVRLATDDFNFDGHKDVAVVDSHDGVTEGYQIFLFDPTAQHFAPLEVKAGGSCAGLAEVTVDATSHTLYSACCGTTWILDAYRYTADGKLYLYQSTEETGLAEDPALQRLFGIKEGSAPIGRLLTYDDKGHVTARALAYRDSLSVVRANARVAVDHLALHDKPGVGVAKRFIVRGDAVEVEDVSGDLRWARVAYRSSAGASVHGWVTVTGLAPLSSAGQPGHEVR